MNLILIGLRGSGKTTVGRIAAQRLSRSFIDLDDETARSLGAGSLGAAWRAHGEPAFRLAETRSLRDVLQGRDRVIALGGGTPTAPGAADLLREAQRAGRARVVYLWAPPAALRARLAGTDLSARPSLTGDDPLAEMDRVLAQRDGLFRSLADVVLATDGHTAEEVATLVVAAESAGKPA